MILSVLDQSPIRSGGTAAQAIQETLQLAELADRLGYHRYWLAEHHSSGGLAGSAPEVLIGQVASRTSRIRVGSGGVMLSHYSALKVAENFRVLEALFPGRIDLGIGRALWILGSSGEGALLAAHFGTAFSYAHFINAEGGTEAARAYRESFRPSPRLAAPQASVVAFVICADTEEQAERLARCRDLFITRLYTGRFGPFPSVEEAAAYEFSPPELAIVANARARTVAGTPDRVKAHLEALAAGYGVDEVVVVTIAHELKARLRSYELLAEVFGLF